MRAIALVDKIEFQFMGNVARNGLTLGDVDNDGCYELVVGSNSGEVAIFKGKEKVQVISDLGFVVCVAIGDILNKGQNYLVIITADGWCYIYAAIESSNENISTEEIKVQTTESLESSLDSVTKKSTTILKCIHTQRIPANAKNIVLGDIDEDGKIEVILGLTDRVVRSYRWLDETDTVEDAKKSSSEEEPPVLGRLVALNKWECANQIGSITLHHSADGKPALLVAQPGGTFMRIRCYPDDNSLQSESSEQNETNPNASTSDIIVGSSVDYQFLGRSRMRSQNISTEILGDFKTLNIKENTEDSSNSSTTTKICPYTVATLDGTIMLVQDEVILWAIAVDHQIFALTKLDVTGNGSDDIVVCSWDGQTYFLDQDKNCISFNLEEPVQAFDSGYFNLSTDQPPVTALVYVTFKNTIIVYYDIPLKDMVIRRFNVDPMLVEYFMINESRSREDAIEFVQTIPQCKKAKLVSFLLYGE